jgi:uncharacterized beta-barrel protein YwiB (DUF1934 family)
MNLCPKCGELIKSKDETCPKCNTLLVKDNVEILDLELPMTKEEKELELLETPLYVKKEECDEHIEFSTDGFISEKGDTVEITYKENAELGMADIESTLRFKKNRPNFVNLIRNGSAPASLVFDSHFPRQNCSYCIGNLPFSFCIITNEVKNTFDEFGGKIILDYQIEMHGVVTEHNVYTLEYKK